ncbi:FAD-dependent monooxygenase [Streptomyces sp. NPDC096132]|uniref:FAD-dependent monooxygenase n=1 Tax=unclassified Streptomyces TaxID=2593676 RepID=UPI0038300483
MKNQLRVGIVGGSLVGMTAAVLLRRQGHAVTVFERSTGTLDERGAGLGLPHTFLDELTELGLFDPEARGLRSSVRRVFSVNSGDLPLGRVVGTQPMIVEMQHWGLVYRQISSRAQDVDIRRGTTVSKVVPGERTSAVHLPSGAVEEFDLVIGADGYRSRVRADLFPDARPVYSGYPVWRGVVDEERIADISPVEDSFQSIGTKNGGTAIYLVPGHKGEHAKGRRRLNWAWYDGNAPLDVLGAEYDDEGRVSSLQAVSAGEKMPDAMLEYLRSAAATYLPPWHRDIIVNTPDPAMQGIWDLELPHYVNGTACLAGDAGSIARPHTASGGVKGITDALALARLVAASDTLDEALAAYDIERPAAGAALVKVGQAFGSQQVLNAPDYSTMDQKGFEAWIAEGASAMHYAFREAAKA